MIDPFGEKLAGERLLWQIRLKDKFLVNKLAEKYSKSEERAKLTICVLPTFVARSCRSEESGKSSKK